MACDATRSYVRKLTYLQREEAFARAVHGEPAHAIARDMGVTEGALRWHWRKGGTHPRDVWNAAWKLYEARIAIERLSPRERKLVQREIERQRREAGRT